MEIAFHTWHGETAQSGDQPGIVAWQTGITSQKGSKF